MFAKNSNIYSMTYDVLYTGSADGTFRAIDIETSQCLFSLNSHSSAILSLYEYNDILFANSADKTVNAFNRLSTQCVSTYTDAGIPFCIAVYNGTVFIGSSVKSDITMWDYKAKSLENLKGHQNPVKCMCIFGNVLYTGSEDGTIKVWALQAETFGILPSDEKQVLLHSIEGKEETEDERQAKLTREIYNKIEAMEDQMMVMSKNIQDLYLILKRVEGQLEKPKPQK